VLLHFCVRGSNRISSCSRFHSHPIQQNFGCIPEISKWKEFAEYLELQHQNNVIIFTDAHKVGGLRPYIENMDELYEANGRKVTKVSQEIFKYCRNKDLKSCFQAVENLKGVGPFTAWQVVCDLMESQCLKPCTENDWVELGPGAQCKQFRFHTSHSSFIC
jgi:hypothetical protein